jgi:hypothetical protein
MTLDGKFHWRVHSELGSVEDLGKRRHSLQDFLEGQVVDCHGV